MPRMVTGGRTAETAGAAAGTGEGAVDSSRVDCAEEDAAACWDDDEDPGEEGGSGDTPKHRQRVPEKLFFPTEGSRADERQRSVDATCCRMAAASSIIFGRLQRKGDGLFAARGLDSSCAGLPRADRRQAEFVR
jgi:hypothetical protein